MRDIKFDLIYKSDTSGFHHKKYYLSELMSGIGKICDIHHCMRLAAERQYTELKDWKGVEVYSDDLIGGNSKSFGAVFGVVKLSIYDDNEGYINEKHLGWNVNGIPLIDLINDGCVVVGNIYENPDLLESL